MSVPSFEPTEEEVSSEVEPTEAGIEEIKDNPAWTPILEALPDDDTRNLVRPQLSEWDKGLQKKFETYAPYKTFVEEKVDPALLGTGLRLVETLNTDPLSVYNRLRQHLEQTGQLEKIAEQEAASKEEETDEDRIESRFKTLEQQNQEFLQRVQQFQEGQEQEKYVAQAREEIQKELSAIEKDGLINDENRNELLRRTQAEIALAASQGQEPPTLTQVYEQIKPYLKRAAAPKVVPPGGGFPSGRKDMGSTTPAERKKMIQELL
jgi:hypothetical protein